MSNVADIGATPAFDDPGLWVCKYDGIEYRDEHVYAQHMLMAHGEIVPVGGVVPVNPVTPPAPTPVYIPPADPGPWPTPAPAPDPVVFTPIPDPPYTPAPVIPVYNPDPGPVPGSGSAFSAGALLFGVLGLLSLGRSRSRSRRGSRK